jgi:peroxiredoxin Q/BCP
VYFAASVDKPEDNEKFAQQLGVDFPLLSDPSRRVAKAYGVVKDERSYATRCTFYIGTDGKILYIDRQVNPGSHGQDIAAKLAELGVSRRAAAGGR